MAGVIHSYQVSAETAEYFSDPYRVAAAEQRFADAARRLPATGVIVYLSDLACDGCAKESGQADSGPRRQGGEMLRGSALRNAGNAAIVAARYALAPRLVTPALEAPTAEWALGNFSRPLDFSGFGARLGFTMVADLGNGVVLYRRAKP